VGGGVQLWGCYVARGAWLRPVGGILTVSRPAVTQARAARRCSDSSAPGADGRAPVVVRVGRERRETRSAWASPGRKRVGRAQMNSMFLDLFKLIQTSSTNLIKSGTYQAPKIPNKIWIERA
jgi:hypothetical protein